MNRVDRAAGSVAAPDISVEQARLLEPVCNAFEAAWRAGKRVDIAVAIDELPEEVRRFALKELIGLDIFYRRKAGESPLSRDYVDRFPDLDEDWLVATIRGGESGTIDLIPAATDVGTIIHGRYKLRQELGEGGMGTVFMAEQTEPVKRMVALKVVKAGMDSKQVLARFEAERQALALMDHPNIARVLDAGTTESGQPFFVMDLVRGVPLNQYCDERQLSVGDRLKIFQQVCQAIQHAHQKGIIHRDLKPANILIESHDGKPVPKIIDFGLAKAMNAMTLTDRSLFTQFGSILGTPQYMAPEQAEFNALDVDARADIYALGVILYELLTGTTPLEKKRLTAAVWDEIRRFIKEEEPPTPSARLSTVEGRAAIAAQRHSEPAKLGKFVRGDLDWIVMKALAKERDRRYSSASAFAADVGHFLSDEPVSAGPPTLRYKVRKYLKRNKRPVMAATVIAFALMTAIVGIAWAMIADGRRKAAEAAHAEDLKQRAEAQRQERIHRALEKGLLAVLNADFVVAEEALREAEAAGASPEQILMIRALLALTQGKTDEAIKLLQDADKLLPDNVAARGMLAYVFGYAGDAAKLEETINDLSRLQPVTPEDFLFKGLGESLLDAQKAWPTLQQAFAGRQTPVIRLVHADVRAAYMQQVGATPDELRDAIKNVSFVRELFPDNPFALRASLRTQLIAIDVFRDAGLDAELEQAKEQARLDAGKLRASVRNLDVANIRYYFAREVDGDKAALDESKRSFDWTKPPHRLVAYNHAEALYLNGQFEAAAKVMEDVLERDKDFFLGYWVRLFATAELPDGKRRTNDLCAEILKKELTGWDAYNRILMLYFVGRSNDAQSLAKDFLSKEKSFPALRKEQFKNTVRYLAGDMSKENLLQGGMNRADQCNAYLSIGLKCLASGDRKQAKEYFEKTIATRVIDFVPYDMSYLILSRMNAPGNEQWPSWIDTKKRD